MSKIKFDFVVHWLWTITFAALCLSGLAMVGAKYGWIMNFDIASADYIHRIMAAAYVILTFISIAYEVVRGFQRNEKKLPWSMIGKSGYQLFTFITTLIFIITGAIIWICMETNKSALAFALFIHENLTYIAIASVIWHIYVKCHALVLKKRAMPGKTLPEKATE